MAGFVWGALGSAGAQVVALLGCRLVGVEGYAQGWIVGTVGMAAVFAVRDWRKS